MPRKKVEPAFRKTTMIELSGPRIEVERAFSAAHTILGQVAPNCSVRYAALTDTAMVSDAQPAGGSNAG